MTKFAVFDWNGTLLDDVEINHQASNKTLEFFGVEPQTRAQYLDAFTFPILHFYKRSGVDVDSYLRHAEEAGSIFIANYEARVKQVKLRQGAKSVLTWLAQNDVHVLLLSNYMQAKITPQLRDHGIDSLFTNISGNVNAKAILEGLNKQERLADYMKKYDLKPSDTFIIGDSLEEIDIARNMGLTGISISGGCISKRRLDAHNPDFLIESLEELPKIQQNLWEL